MFELSQPEFSRPLTGAAQSTRSPGATVVGTAGAPPALRRFVAGEENRLALSAVEKFLDDAAWSAENAAQCGAQADDDAARGAPLVLHGPSGTGKTHLVDGLVAEWSARLPDDVVVRLAGSEFAEQYAEAVDQDRIAEFRRRVRAADLFVLEDLARLATKPQAQWELLHALDELARRGAYVVVTLDAPPQKFETFLPGLVSRLAEGFVFALSPPSQTSRRAILAELAAERGLALDPKALDLLAADRETTVRELRGALAGLEAEAREQARREAAGTLFPLRAGEPVAIDLPLVKRHLEARGGAGAVPTLKQIIEQTARHFGLRAADLKSGSRRRSVVTARDTAIYLARRLTKKSLHEIGEYFGGRDHTTVLHSCRKLETADGLDPEQIAALAVLRERLVRG